MWLVGTLVLAAVSPTSTVDIGLPFEGFGCTSFSPKNVVVEDPVVNGCSNAPLNSAVFLKVV